MADILHYTVHNAWGVQAKKCREEVGSVSETRRSTCFCVCGCERGSAGPASSSSSSSANRAAAVFCSFDARDSFFTDLALTMARPGAERLCKAAAGGGWGGDDWDYCCVLGSRTQRQAELKRDGASLE